MVFRGDPVSRVMAFIAAEIPDIAGRVYPPSLSGPLYPLGIPILDESELPGLIRREEADWVYFCYRDVSHQEVMYKASLVLGAGASFGLLGPHQTSNASRRPVIRVGAVRTGVGKNGGWAASSRKKAEW